MLQLAGLRLHRTQGDDGEGGGEGGPSTPSSHGEPQAVLQAQLEALLRGAHRHVALQPELDTQVGVTAARHSD